LVTQVLSRLDFGRAMFVGGALSLHAYRGVPMLSWVPWSLRITDKELEIRKRSEGEGGT